jgi:hypothetical protein
MGEECAGCTGLGSVPIVLMITASGVVGERSQGIFCMLGAFLVRYPASSVLIQSGSRGIKEASFCPIRCSPYE